MQRRGQLTGWVGGGGHRGCRIAGRIPSPATQPARTTLCTRRHWHLRVEKRAFQHRRLSLIARGDQDALPPSRRCPHHLPAKAAALPDRHERPARRVLPALDPAMRRARAGRGDLFRQPPRPDARQRIPAAVRQAGSRPTSRRARRARTARSRQTLSLGDCTRL